MTAPHADQLIEGYLARVSAVASGLPSGARSELLGDLRSHIAEARSREQDETDATILNILDRLGEPALVVGEARERLGLRTPPTMRPGLVEIAAVVILPFFWVIGVILLWLSPAWRVRDKIIGTLLSFGGYPTILVIVAAFGTGTAPRGIGGSCTSVTDSAGNLLQSSCTGPSALDVTGFVLSLLLLIAIFLLPLLTAAYLAIRLKWGRVGVPLAA
jgi:uncharacterized membrane protein